MIFIIRNGSNGDKFGLGFRRLLNSFRPTTIPAAKAPTTTFITAKKARQTFLDYYVKENSYSFVKSSPVVPFHDATVPFVNAGMNQFKGIFLNTHTPLHAKVANTQKCIRIGGKHNDLDAVGQDGYHHTFFEMLGNWTFKQCSKEEQCRLAWTLLTDVFKINKHQLYVTYFGGNQANNLPADTECRDIWRQLGIPQYRILPFDMQENFWEMGATGPCGPCTEIHYDHLRGPQRAQFVNKGLHELVELWNIVFIEYKREADGSIVPLPEKHVDTGMGFERLVAVLQHHVSNYDTDNFSYLFKAIFKNCQDVPQYKSVFGEHDWNSLNTNYRILADHVRMITVALADGMIPEENQKLRKVLRRAFQVAENAFKKPEHLVKELSNYVIDHLGGVYPEMETNSRQIHQIIEYEEEIYRDLRCNAISDWGRITHKEPQLATLDVLEMPGFIQAYNDIKKENLTELTPQTAYKMYDTYGLDETGIDNLCKCLKVKFNASAFHLELAQVKTRSKNATATISNEQFPELLDGTLKTDDSYKYLYDRKDADGGYSFLPVDVQILKIFQRNIPVDCIKAGTVAGTEAGDNYALVLDKTSLYHESGGQLADHGRIVFTAGEFRVRDLKKMHDCVLHVGDWLSDQELKQSFKGKLELDATRRIAMMRNHTAMHLLNAVLKQVKGATCQKSSKVTDKFLSLDVGIFTEKLTPNELAIIEGKINTIIDHGAEVRVSVTDAQEMLRQNVTVIPGEVYPEKDIRLVEVACNDVVSREPCCGTHVLNTKDIDRFCFISAKSLGRSTVSIYGLTGVRASKAQALGERLLGEVNQLEKSIEFGSGDNLDDQVDILRQKMISHVEDDNVVPLLIKVECLKILDRISQQLRDKTRNKLRDFIDVEMKSAVETRLLKSDLDNEFIVHYLHTTIAGEAIPLQKATRVVSTIPVMIITCADSVVKARCTVPENFKSETFTAEKWMRVVGDIFKSAVQAPKGQDKELVCNLKGKKINDSEWQALLNKSMEAAELYAKKHL